MLQKFYKDSKLDRLFGMTTVTEGNEN